MDAPCRVRPAEPDDLPAIHAIERVAFSDPWSLSQLAQSLAAGWPFLVADGPDGVAGYAVAHFAGDEAEILNLGVAPAVRRHGIGRALVRALLARLAALGVDRVFLEVRESNAAAQQLYAALGFELAGRRRGYYRQPVEDAIVLRTANLSAGGDA